MSAASEERSGKPARGCLRNGPLLGASAWTAIALIVFVAVQIKAAIG